MAQKRSLLVLITLFNTLLLVAGLAIIFGSTEYNVCSQCYCYAIKEFILFYQMIFFTFGILLAAVSAFAFFALFLENQAILNCFGKMLVFLLLLLFVMIWLGLWGKAPTFLRATMHHSFKSYNTGNCRLDASIDALQRRFSCCGIERPEDWTLIRAEQKTNITLEPPLSCCSPVLFLRELDSSLKCLSTYQNGCYAPLRRYIWRIINIITVIGFAVALNMTLTIVCVFQYVKILKRDRLVPQNQQPTFEANLTSALQNQAAPLYLYQDSTGVKTSASSTVV